MRDRIEIARVYALSDAKYFAKRISAAYRPAKKSHSGTTIAWMSPTSTRYESRSSGSRPFFTIGNFTNL
jgi:hypothetical protein